MRHDDESIPPQQFRDWRMARIEARGDIEVTERSMMRRGQVVLSQAAVERLADVLVTDYDGRPREGDDAVASLGFQRWNVDAGRSVLDVVTELRAELGAEAADPAYVVSPTYVLTGEPKYAGGPGGTPRTTPDRWAPAKSSRGREPDIAVLDTGVPDDLASLHPGVAAAVRRDSDDRDELYRPGGGRELLSEAGHGTFITGLVLRLAPGLAVDVGEVLDPEGIGDDASVTAELLETMAPVVNLSLGGYTEDDAPPPLLAAALQRWRDEHPDRVVVAAAGNNGSDRLFWPAALATSDDAHVVSVAAGDRRGDTVVRAPFSNVGEWVLASTYGVGIVSTYVRGTYPGPRGPASFSDNPFAVWDGTSFAAPILAAEIARRSRDTGAAPIDVWEQLRGELQPAPAGMGGWFEPAGDPRTF